jgi:hypothetical protein
VNNLEHFFHLQIFDDDTAAFESQRKCNRRAALDLLKKTQQVIGQDRKAEVYDKFHNYLVKQISKLNQKKAQVNPD